ncbi:MAG: type II toxin-antitoxin system VapB family antitoxin [Steroidobacteraceae bacterium]
MKTTVDIPSEVLDEAIRYTQAKTKREAIVTAMQDFIRRKRMSELVRYSGTSDTLLTNDEIEALERRRAPGFEKTDR